MKLNCISLSRLILDDLEFKDKTYSRILGGGGTYAVFGMRLVTKNVGFVVKFGIDFDPVILRKLDINLHEICLEYDTPQALNSYIDNHRTFKLLTENYDKFRTFPFDVPSDWEFSHIHGVLSYKRLAEINSYFPASHIIWEPNPDDLQDVKSLWNNWEASLKLVKVASPNHTEALEC